MSFSTLPFLFYFLPAFLAVYYIVPARFRNAVLALGSLLFYWLGAGTGALLVLVALILVNFAAGRLIEDAHGDERRAWLILALACDVGSLFYFKYMGWFLENLGRLTNTDFSFFPCRPAARRELLCISEHRLHRGRLPRRRRGRAQPFGLCRLSGDVPQLVMGPILRLRDVSAELHTKRPFSRAAVESGFSLFVVGLGCKVVLADQLASLWTALERIGFAYLPRRWRGSARWATACSFTTTSRATRSWRWGFARMLGFVIPRNFDLPYCSRSISEFWRRWHITLGIWFRDYLYIPLGGSRNGKRRLLLSLFVVWTLTGLWHGAAWNFVLWGLVLFVFIALEKFCIGGFRASPLPLASLFSLLIPQTWVVFRISDLGELGDYFSRLYPFLSSGESVFAGDLLRQLESYWWLFALGILLATPGRAASMKVPRDAARLAAAVRGVLAVSLSHRNRHGQPVPLRPLLNFF